MASIRFIPNAAGFRELLHSSGVAAELERRGNAVKEAADATPWDHLVSGVPGKVEMEYDVEVDQHPTRVAVHVGSRHPAALAVEAKHRVLGRAIDAARQ